MTRSKVLVVVLVLAVALAGGTQALSVVPHVHGADTDHSSDPACPVHQLQNHSLQAVEAGTSVEPVLAHRAEAAPPLSFSFVLQTFPLQEPLRGPPASF